VGLFSRKIRQKLNKITVQTGNLNRNEALDRSTRILIPMPIEEKRLTDASLHWTRENACLSLDLKGKSFLEIGTLAGDFAQFLIESFEPSRITLVDFFDAADYVFGEQRFTPENHFDYVKKRFESSPNVKLERGESSKVLNSLILSGQRFDFIYIDAGHTFEDVSRDIELAFSLLNPGGIIGMNDYIMTDYYYDTTYGVVQATNNFLDKHPEFKVRAFAFNNNLFADIYLQDIGTFTIEL
jgi:predicted O-methyltransferase YrrM